MSFYITRAFAGLTRNTFLLAFSSFFADISTEMLYPVLPVFLTVTLGASGAVLGLVDGLAQATQNIALGFSGALSDRLQRRKPIAIIGYLLAALSKPLMGTATAWQSLFAARLLDRLGTGMRSAPRDALVAASADEENRGKAFGLEGLGDNAGAFLGPLVTVFLLYLLHIEVRTVFYLAVVPGLLAFFIMLFVREGAAKTTVKAKIDLSVRPLPAAYWRYLAAAGVFALGNSSTSFLILQAQDSGASLETAIFIYAAYNLVAALISYPAGALSDRLGRKRVLLAAFLLFALAYIGFALAETIEAISIFFAACGVYQGIYRGVGKALAADFVPASLRATGVGFYGAATGLAQLAASLIAGVLWDTAGHKSVFFVGAGFAVIGCLTLTVMVPDAPKSLAVE